MLALLQEIYGEEVGRETFGRVEALMAGYRKRLPEVTTAVLTARDAILITYADQVGEAGKPFLPILTDFCQAHLQAVVSAIHLLPFYPYSSDDGFSVIDYQQVRPDLGDWMDVARLGQQFRLMFDAVINHISAESAWFQGFLRDEPRYRDYFTVVEPTTDLSTVFRPRALPLLTEVETAVGRKHVWTTFSPDQIDLNYRNPDVLLEVLETLLFYVSQGAEFIRLDAIAFMWKEVGTRCLHLPQTHQIIQLMRALLDEAAPHVILITETNVPHEENISYFGDGRNEAQMVYNFSLPPLTLHTFHQGDASALSQWADGLRLPGPRTTFFNFLASHDGIGLTPARGFLSEGQIGALAARVEALGGFVSNRHQPDGSVSPYELNVNYLDALGIPGVQEDVELVARRFMAAQAMMLALRGVPGIYFHSLFGSRGWPEGVAQLGYNRAVNRQKLARADLERELADPLSLRQRVFQQYRHLLRVRGQTAVFDPAAEQQILFLDPALFCLVRVAGNGREAVLCLHNVTNQRQSVSIDLRPLELTRPLWDVVGGREVGGNGRYLSLTLHPYQVFWLRPT
ncbi:MAG: sugar phosphorylase [Chloroflexi bacterium]|nr:sugar phosphorylase [Chloroflexota bacterium]